MSNCPSCNSTNSLGTTICRFCGASIPEPATWTADLEQEVRSLLDQGKKIEAVKVYKHHTGSGLKDAKDAVEALAKRHGITVKGAWCSGVLIVCMLALIAIAVVAVLMIIQK